MSFKSPNSRTTDQDVSLDHHSLPVALDFPSFISFNQRDNKRIQQILFKIILAVIDNTDLTGSSWMDDVSFLKWIVQVG